jgi:hypothetical protein
MNVSFFTTLPKFSHHPFLTIHVILDKQKDLYRFIGKGH